MKEIFQTSVYQTGLAIILMKNGECNYIPLFSTNPISEADEFYDKMIDAECVKHVYICNNLMQYKIEEAVEEFTRKFNFLPYDLMEDMVSGFPWIMGSSNTFFMYA